MHQQWRASTTPPSVSETIKTSVTDHYGKYGVLNGLFGTNVLAAPINQLRPNSSYGPNSGSIRPFAVQKRYERVLFSLWQAAAKIQEQAGKGYELDGKTNLTV